VIGYGSVCSAAVVVLQAGDRRLLAPNTELMIHPGHASMNDETEENLARFAMQAVRYRNRYYRILADKMGLSLREMLQAYDKDVWLGARQAIRLGLADGIL